MWIWKMSKRVKYLSLNENRLLVNGCRGGFMLIILRCPWYFEIVANKFSHSDFRHRLTGLNWHLRNCQSDGPSGGSRLVAPVSDQSICDLPMTQAELDNCRGVYPTMTVTQCQEFTWTQCQQNQCIAECLAPCDDNDWDCRNPCYETTCNPCATLCDARCTEVTGGISSGDCHLGCMRICYDFNSDHSGEFIQLPIQPTLRVGLLWPWQILVRNNEIR